MSDFNLMAIDSDQAVQEVHHNAVAALEAEGDTRAAFLRRVGVGGAAAMSGGALLSALVPGSALAAGGGRPPASFGPGDAGILNFALTLEYLESTFYNEAASHLLKHADHQTRTFINQTRDDENAHVKALKAALGRAAVRKPKFKFGKAVTDLKTFKATAYVLENTGVRAYSGQAFNIRSHKVLGAALSIVTVEARHAGAIALITNQAITFNGGFDKPLTADAVLSAVKGTGFIVG